MSGELRSGIPLELLGGDEREMDESERYDANIHYNAFTFCLNARHYGWAKEAMVAALDGQWEATEWMAKSGRSER